MKTNFFFFIIKCIVKSYIIKFLEFIKAVNQLNFDPFQTVVWSQGLSVKRVLDGLLLLCQKTWMSLGLPVTLGDIPRSLHPLASESLLTSSEADVSDSCLSFSVIASASTPAFGSLLIGQRIWTPPFRARLMFGLFVWVAGSLWFSEITFCILSCSHTHTHWCLHMKFHLLPWRAVW